MNSMQHEPRPVNLIPATEWPSWCDEDTFGLGPDPSDDDAAWWAAHAPGNGSDYDVEDMEEGAAYEAAAVDALSRGLIPADVAESIARTSLVGLADEMADAYADEAERVSGRRPGRDEAGRSVSLAWFRHGCRA